jgi:nicotinamidase-related amidase
MLRDYRVVMLSDANATWTDEEHAGALNTFAIFFGDVMTTDEAIGRMVPVAQRKSA